MTEAVQWRDMSEPPSGDLIAVRVPYGIFLHCMVRKDGYRATWAEQGDRWTDGVFEYADVTHWVRLA